MAIGVDHPLPSATTKGARSTPARGDQRGPPAAEREQPKAPKRLRLVAIGVDHPLPSVKNQRRQKRLRPRQQRDATGDRLRLLPDVKVGGPRLQARRLRQSPLSGVNRVEHASVRTGAGNDRSRTTSSTPWFGSWWFPWTCRSWTRARTGTPS